MNPSENQRVLTTFDDWLSHPCTAAFRRLLSQKREDLKELWAGRGIPSDDMQRVLGEVSFLADLITLTDPKQPERLLQELTRHDQE